MLVKFMLIIQHELDNCYYYYNMYIALDLLHNYILYIFNNLYIYFVFMVVRVGSSFDIKA